MLLQPGVLSMAWGSVVRHNTAGLKATAMRLVNAIPAVVEARPGLLTTLDLPLVMGRGLVRARR